jgi:hypothetical protein
MRGDGFIALDAERNLAGISANMDHQFEWMLSKEGVTTHAKVIDVMLGPV